MAPLTRRRLLLEHADRIDAHGARRREDPIRVATAALEASGSADPQLLVRAARLARYGHDFTQVERRPPRSSTASPPKPDCSSARHCTRSATSRRPTSCSPRRKPRPTTASRWCTSRRCGREISCGAYSATTMRSRRTDAPRERLSDPANVEELTLNEAMLLSYSGRPFDAPALLDSIPAGTTTRTHAIRTFAQSPALIATGKCETAVAEQVRAFEEQIELPDPIAIPGPGVHIINQIYALTECGRLHDATALAAEAYEATPANAPPDAFMWLSSQQGRCALLAGPSRPRGAGSVKHWRAAKRAISEDRADSCSRALATAHAYAGDAAASAAAVVQLEALTEFRFARAEQELGHAWALVAAGDLPGARDVLLAGADLAAASGYRSTEAWLLHDIARLGDAAAVAGRLEELSGQSEGELVAAYADHAMASAAAAARPSSSRPNASSSSAPRSSRPRPPRRPPRPSAARRRQGRRRGRAPASSLAGRCEGARTPGLTAPAMVDPLTPPRARHRHLRGEGRVEQGHRRAAVPVGAHGEQPPAERLYEAWCRRPARARGRPRRRAPVDPKP